MVQHHALRAIPLTNLPQKHACMALLLAGEALQNCPGMIFADACLLLARPLANCRASNCRPSSRRMRPVNQSFNGLLLLVGQAAHPCTHDPRSESAARPSSSTAADLRYRFSTTLLDAVVDIRKNVVPTS
jgi:hypothetical protein